LKLWFVIRHYGVEGLRAHIRYHVALAGIFERLVAQSDMFELALPRSLNLVCFYHVNGDEAGERLLNRVNEEGNIYLTHTKLNDRYTLRLCIGQSGTDEGHVRNAFEILEETARLTGKPNPA